MRIRFALFVALLALSLALLGWAHTAVSASADAVTLEETVLEGDPAAAAGIGVDLRTKCLDHLFWDTRYVAGPEGSIHTEYTYFMNENRYRMSWVPGGMQLDFWGNSGVTREGEAEDEYGMQKPFNDVASRCPPGAEDYTEWVDLRDYYTEYPIYAQGVDLVPSDTSLYLPEGGRSIEKQVAGELRRCFPIPVQEGTYMEIRVDRREDGHVFGYSFSTPDSAPTPEVSSVVTDRGCYFTLSSPRGAEPKLDTGRFVPGYGVYFLPVELTPAPESIRASWREDVMTMQTGAIERVYPVDPAVDYALLYAGADKSRMYLVTQTEGQCVLTVLDAANGRELERLSLFSVPAAGEETPYLQDLLVREDILVPYLSDGRFAVVTVADGGHQIALTGSFENLNENGLYLSGSSRWSDFCLPALDFDGERLAVADMLDYPQVCSFFLAVYDRTGPSFLGTYSNSQDRGGDGGNGACKTVEPDPLTVRLPRKSE